MSHTAPLDAFYRSQTVFLIFAFIMTSNLDMINISQLPSTIPTNVQFSLRNPSTDFKVSIMCVC